MEKLLFRKIEAWVVLLLAILAAVAMVFFGWLVHLATKETRHRSTIDNLVLSIAKLPEDAAKMAGRNDPRLAERAERFAGRSGWTFANAGKGLAGDGYLLLSRYSGDEDRHVVEMLDLRDFSIRHVWRPDADILLVGARRESKISDFSRWNRRLFEVAHPLLLADGSMIVKDQETPVMRLDQCGKRLWMQDVDLFHHSTNIDADGNIWVPSRIEPTDPRYGGKFDEQAVAEISPDGKLLQEISLPKLLEASGYAEQMFSAGRYVNDPVHLNDIQPALSSGPYWEKGDLFLSMRHLSMIAQYRPSTGKIIWAKQGPWLAQHDVDIIDDHTIAVFNNSAYDRGEGWFIEGNNDITFYDFASDTVSHPYQAVMKALDIKTLTEGLFEITEVGRTIIEEENSGRLVILDKDKSLTAEFINRAADGRVFTMGWSRYVPRALGDAALGAISKAGCKDG